MCKSIFIICVAIPFKLFAQDSIVKKKIFSVSYNITQTFMNEYDNSFENRINDKFFLGLTLGKIRYSYAFDPLFISPSQDKWPGTVYQGHSLRAYLKYYRGNKPFKYWDIQMLYKNMSYNNI